MPQEAKKKNCKVILLLIFRNINEALEDLCFLLFLLCCVKIDSIKEISNAYKPIYLEDGFGSSSRIRYKNKCYLVTANHVIPRDEDLILLSSEDEILSKVFSNEDKDLYLINTTNCKNSIKYKEPKNLTIGSEVHYWCMPAATDLKYYKGYVSGIKDDSIVIYGYTWFGCSGAGVFTKDNELIGIISSMMATPNPSMTDFMAHENVISISIFKKTILNKIGKIYMDKELNDLSNYFKKNNLNNYLKINKIITLANQNIPTSSNEIMKDFARANDALKKIGDSSINFGSTVQFGGKDNAVYNVTKEDFLGGSWYLCMKPDSNINIPNSKMVYDFVTFSKHDTELEGATDEQRAVNYLKKYRRNMALGGQSKIVTYLLSGHSPSMSTEIYVNSLKRLVVIHKDLEVIQIEKFDVDSASLSEFADLALDLTAIGAAILSATVSGGAAAAVRFAKILSDISKGAMLVGIFNNLLAGKYLDAMIGIAALYIGRPQSSKTLLRAYTTMFRGPNAKYILGTGPSVLFTVPQYVLAIASALIETLQYVVEFTVDKLRELKDKLMEEYGLDKDFATEEELLQQLKTQKIRALESLIYGF